MAGTRAASDERTVMAGIAVIAWLGALGIVSLLLSIADRTTAPTRPVAVHPAEPPVAASATLPPTVVVAARTVANNRGACRRATGLGPGESHCPAAARSNGVYASSAAAETGAGARLP